MSHSPPMNAHTIHDTTHMMVGLHHHPDLLPLQGQLTAATSRQNRSSNRRGFLNRPSNRRGLSLDSYIGRLSLKGTWKGILEVSAFLVYYITVLCSSTSQITRTSQQVWRVHLVYVASGITSSRQSHRRTDQPSTTGHASSTTKRGALKWLTQEADATNWSSPKHVQPEEGRKEPAPRAIKFRKSRAETTI